MSDLNRKALFTRELPKLQREKDVILSTALRDNIFLPFALECLNYDIKFVDSLPFPQDVPACTDYETIWICPTSAFFTVVGKRITRSQLLSTLFMHEVLHIMLQHNRRRGHRDPELWNIACDYVINLILKHLEEESHNQTSSKADNLVNLGISEIPDGYILLNSMFENMLEEEVYSQLASKSYKKKKYYMSYADFKNSVDGEGETPSISKSPEDIDGQVVEITETTIDLPGLGGHTRTDINFPPLEQIIGKDKAGEKEGRTAIARGKLGETLSKGIGSTSFQAFLRRLLKIKIDWARILKDSILTALQVSQDQIWHMPRTVWLANPYMPYLPNFDEDEIPGYAIFVSDQSGSMSDEDVTKALSITIEADEYYDGVLLATHDYDNVWLKFYEKGISGEKDEIKDLLKRRHAGGTSHKWVFEKIAEFMKSRQDIQPSVLVGCTDLYSDLETTQNIIPSSIPRVWIVNSDHNVHGLLGRVIRINQ
jgi:predicted metal-dependent peptidase